MSATTKEAEVVYLGCKDNLREEEEVLSNFKKAINIVGHTQNLKCSMPFCAITAADAMGDVDWIQCIQCGTD